MPTTDFSSPADVRAMLAWLDPEHIGQTVTLDLLRGGAPLSLGLTVDERPAATSSG